MELSLDRLSKQYDSKIAVDSISATLTPGVYGLLGANGAGKTTLMRMLCGILEPTSGEVLFNDHEITAMGATYRNMLGYLPQDFGYYPNYTAMEFMLYMAALKGIPRNIAVKRIKKLLTTVDLNHVASKRIKTFSGGMKQRVGIAQALLNNPKVLILDEPTAGLDPKERIRIRNLVAQIAFDKIVIIATHVVSDIEFIAKEVLLMKRGEIIDSGAPHILCEKIDGKVFEITADESMLDEISAKYKVGNISKDEKNIYVRVISEQPPTYECKTCKPDLEDLYLYYFD